MSRNGRTKKIHKKKYKVDEEPKNNIFLTSIFKQLDQDTVEILQEMLSSPDVMKLNNDEFYRFLWPTRKRKN